MIRRGRSGPDLPGPADDLEPGSSAEGGRPEAPAPSTADADPSTAVGPLDAPGPSTAAGPSDARNPSTAAGPLNGPELAAERRALIDLVIYAYDRAPGAGVRSRLAEGLAAVGVAAIRPDGERFDPGRHEAGGVEPTDDTARHGTVAETELVGFEDRSRVIRVPIVIVYRHR